MQVFTIPTSDESLTELRQHCEAHDLPAPRCWRLTHFHRTLRDLASSGEPFPPPERYRPTLQLAGLSDPVIVFCNVHPQKIQQVAMAYKRAGSWPIFAAITKQSQEMPLYVLLEHLKDDRRTESQHRQRLRQQAT